MQVARKGEHEKSSKSILNLIYIIFIRDNRGGTLKQRIQWRLVPGQLVDWIV